MPIELTNTDNYLPPDDPNVTNLMVSQYDCEKQQHLRKFNLLNVKQCTEVLSNIQHAELKARVYVRAKVNALKLLNVKLTPKKNVKFVFKAQ